MNMFNLSEWTAAPTHAASKAPAHPSTGGIWINDGELSPLDLYCYLSARFGKSNGSMMALRQPSVNNHIQWHWHILTPHGPIEFYGFTCKTKIHSAFIHREQEWKDFCREIKSDFSRISKEMTEIRNRMQRLKVFANPYARLRRVIDAEKEELIGLRIDSLALPERPSYAHEVDVYNNRISEIQAKYVRASSLGFSLRMQAPVLGESFINLLMLVLLKPAVRNNDRLYTSAFRKEIDVRVLEMSINCDGFSKQIDSKAQEFKNFHSLMNRRNDLLHGNIDPSRMYYSELYFDNFATLYKQQKSYFELAFRSWLLNVEPSAALKDVGIVDAFVEFIFQHMDHGTATVIRKVIRELELGWDEDHGKVAIVVPEPREHFMIVGSKVIDL